MIHLVVWHFICLNLILLSFQLSEGYFNGYFSNKKITDLKMTISPQPITQDDLTKYQDN